MYDDIPVTLQHICLDAKIQTGALIPQFLVLPLRRALRLIGVQILARSLSEDCCLMFPLLSNCLACKVGAVSHTCVQVFCVRRK